MPYVSEHPHDSHDQAANDTLSRRAVIGKGLVTGAAVIAAAAAGARGVTANDAGAGQSQRHSTLP